MRKTKHGEGCSERHGEKVLPSSIWILDILILDILIIDILILDILVKDI